MATLTETPKFGLTFKTDRRCEELQDAILKELSIAPVSGSSLQNTVQPESAVLLFQALQSLEESGIVTFNKVTFKYELVTKLQKSPLQELTIQLPSGLYKSLVAHARTQGTTTELEASWLLAEIIRVYQAQRVIPTR